MDIINQQKNVETFTVRIYIAGSIEHGKQVIREYCIKKGLCVTVEPVDYIYTGGEEKGYVVGLINYPRFPRSNTEIRHTAHHLAKVLLYQTHQHSVSIVDSQSTCWYSIRSEDE